MNFKKGILDPKPFYLLMLLGFMLWVSSAAALSPIQQLQIQSTPVPVTGEGISGSATPFIAETATIEPSPTEIDTPTPTPFPDWAMTSKDTNGLLFAGILILLIITIGTLAAVTKRTPDLNHKKNR
jgi:hypothetical protein